MHGHAIRRTRTYMVWQAMRKRCSNPRTLHYDRYGGRGIAVCKRWDDYAAFLADMGEVKDGLTLERINNDGNYEPGNCRWATRGEQSRNMSRNRIIEFDGKRQCLRDWEKDLGLSSGAIHHRLETGWSIEEALSTPRIGK